MLGSVLDADPESVWEMECFDRLPPELKDYIYGAPGHISAGDVYALWVQWGTETTIATLDKSVKDQLAQEKQEILEWVAGQAAIAKRRRRGRAPSVTH